MSGYSQLEHAKHGKLFEKKGSNPANKQVLTDY